MTLSGSKGATKEGRDKNTLATRRSTNQHRSTKAANPMTRRCGERPSAAIGKCYIASQSSLPDMCCSESCSEDWTQQPQSKRQTQPTLHRCQSDKENANRNGNGNSSRGNEDMIDPDTISSFSQTDCEMTCESGSIVLTETEMRFFENDIDGMDTGNGISWNEIDSQSDVVTSEDSERKFDGRNDQGPERRDGSSESIMAHTNTNTNISASSDSDLLLLASNNAANGNPGNNATCNENESKNANENDNETANTTNTANTAEAASVTGMEPMANLLRTRFQSGFGNMTNQMTTISNAESINARVGDMYGNDANHTGIDVDDNDTNNNSNNNNNNTNNNNFINVSNGDNGYGVESPGIDKTELLSTLYNYMKISEMDRYGIEIFDRGLQSVIKQLSEADFQCLATSYWCNGMHFECMVKYRGTKIAESETLQLSISSSLMDQAVTGGASVNKLKSLLLQKRKDTQNLKKSLKQEIEFFRRNCHIRFWNHEVLVRSFLENGWLTPEIAQIGLDKFLTHIFDRAVKTKSNCLQITTSTGCDITKQEKKNRNRNKHKAKRRNKHKKKGQNQSHHNSDEDDTIGDIHERNKMFGYPCEEDRDTILNRDGNTRDLDPINFSEKTLRRWCCLIEILCSRGAKCPRNKFSNVSQLRKCAISGKNTWWIISSSSAKKNNLLMSVCALTLPSDLWNVVTSYF